MSDWKAKRFWKAVSTQEDTDGFQILLDDRPVRTPGKKALILPTSKLAERVASEWGAQVGDIDPASMPFTRTANSAIDKVAVQFDEIAEMLIAYGDSDLLCYRADGPKQLVDRQAAKWDPVLKWAADELGAALEPRTGVMHKPQTAANIAILAKAVKALNTFELAGFHDLVSRSGSLIIGLAVLREFKHPQEMWAISVLDEDWQREQWGADEDADAMANHKRAEFLHAAAFLKACQRNL